MFYEVKKLCKKLTLVVVRYQPQTKSTLYSKPCKNCIKLIQMVGIKKVIYTTDDGYIIERGNKIENKHISRIEQINIDQMKICV